MPTFRPLYYALLMSVALHVFLFWPRTVPEQAHSKALRAHLRAADVVVAEAVSLLGRRSLREVTSERASSVKQSVSSEVATATQGASPETATLALPSVANGVDAGGLRVYRTGLALGLRRAGFFREGIAPDMRGRLEVEIILSAQGQIIALGIAQGSGNSALDQLALRALGEVGAQTAVPPVLLGQMFRVVVPLVVE